MIRVSGKKVKSPRPPSKRQIIRALIVDAVLDFVRAHLLAYSDDFTCLVRRDGVLWHGCDDTRPLARWLRIVGPYTTGDLFDLEVDCGRPRQASNALLRRLGAVGVTGFMPTYTPASPVRITCTIEELREVAAWLGEFTLAQDRKARLESPPAPPPCGIELDAFWGHQGEEIGRTPAAAEVIAAARRPGVWS